MLDLYIAFALVSTVVAAGLVMRRHRRIEDQLQPSDEESERLRDSVSSGQPTRKFDALINVEGDRYLR